MNSLMISNLVGSDARDGDTRRRAFREKTGFKTDIVNHTSTKGSLGKDTRNRSLA